MSSATAGIVKKLAMQRIFRMFQIRQYSGNAGQLKGCSKVLCNCVQADDLIRYARSDSSDYCVSCLKNEYGPSRDHDLKRTGNLKIRVEGNNLMHRNSFRLNLPE